jgi:hypothetical protein
MPFGSQKFCDLWNLFFQEEFADSSIPPQFDSLIHALEERGLIAPFFRSSKLCSRQDPLLVCEEKAPYFLDTERCLEAYLQLIGEILQRGGYVLLEIRLANGWGGLTILPEEQREKAAGLAREINEFQLTVYPRE